MTTRIRAATRHGRRGEHHVDTRNNAAAGSPNYRIHEHEWTSSEVSVGSALLMPTHYDLPSPVEHQPAAFIATPVLKSTGVVRVPALDNKSALLLLRLCSDDQRDLEAIVPSAAFYGDDPP